jgi:hypothetical protein
VAPATDEMFVSLTTALTKTAKHIPSNLLLSFYNIACSRNIKECFPRSCGHGGYIDNLSAYLPYISYIAAQGANPRLVTSSSGKNKVELLQG